MPKKRKQVQEDMFTGEMVGADTSLFSGTAMKGHEEVFNPPSEVMRMDSMFGCNICHGTGWVKPKRNKPATRCTCPVGQNIKDPRDEMITLLADAVQHVIDNENYCIVCSNHAINDGHTSWCIMNKALELGYVKETSGD